MTCNRKKLSPEQAAVVAQRQGERTKIRHYPVYCEQCRAYHTAKGNK